MLIMLSQHSSCHGNAGGGKEMVASLACSQTCRISLQRGGFGRGRAPGV